jgi:hypothetical protein
VGVSLPKHGKIACLLSHTALGGSVALLLASTGSAAAGYYDTWRQPRIEYVEPEPAPAIKAEPRRQKKRQHQTKIIREQRPQGPFQIVIDISQQQLTLYGQNGVIAQAPVSTGVPGHPTPLGVFSVLSKDKWHRSNIYSGAPMPYMQRITWSGIALHAGPLPGYPASHGCIRLPADFAVRLWDITKVGARVIVTREAATPVEIAHRSLFVPKKQELAAPAEAGKVAVASDNDSAFRMTAAAAPEATGSIPVTPIGPLPSIEQLRAKGPISVFVSRKENRVFVRQGFVPLFDLPLTIAEPGHPLGTHVFTAMALKDEGAAVRWTVASIPSSYARRAEIPIKRSKKSERDRNDASLTPSGPTAADALDRITLPPEAIERISALLTPGASLIVSDNALSDETGSDTDFIVLTPEQSRQK